MCAYYNFACGSGESGVYWLMASFVVMLLVICIYELVTSNAIGISTCCLGN